MPTSEPDDLPIDGESPLLVCEDLAVRYETGAGSLDALAGVSFAVARGRTTALIGESGSGKSTAAKVSVGLTKPQTGSVRFDGVDIASLSSAHRNDFRRSVQMVFQDPVGSLDPRMTVGQAIAEPLEIHRRHRGGPASAASALPRRRSEIRARVAHLLGAVGLDESLGTRRPEELSGGQCQRVALARALALEPRLLVADELVSALDVSVQAQVLNLLQQLQRDLGIACLLVAHDLGVVSQVADTVVVMYLGRVVEHGSVDEVVLTPKHPYTAALLAAVPAVMRSGCALDARLRGEAPSPIGPPPGCHLHPRCPLARQVCREVSPPLVDVGGGRLSACHFPHEVGPVLGTTEATREQLLGPIGSPATKESHHE